MNEIYVRYSQQHPWRFFQVRIRSDILNDLSFDLDESLVKRIERLQDYLHMLEKIKVWIDFGKVEKNELILD